MIPPTIVHAALVALVFGVAGAVYLTRRGGAGAGLGAAREQALEVLGAGMVVVDRRGRVTSCNAEARMLLGLQTEPDAGSRSSTDPFLGLSALRGVPEIANLLVAGEGGAAIDLGGEGNTRRIEARAFRTGRVGRGTVILLSDVSVNAALLEELSTLVTRDPLTGVYNRRRFDELGSRDIELARRSGRSVGVLKLDIDLFKRVNDEHGHSVGDDLLKALCAVCGDGLRSTDIFARHGGEEFVILLPGGTEGESVAVAERLRSRIAAFALPTPNGSVSVTVSVGVYSGVPANGEGIDFYLKRADEALYWSEARGRNRVSHWAPMRREEA